MKQMIVVFVLSCFIFGCDEDNSTNARVTFVSFDEDFQIGVDDQVVVTGNQSSEVTDSLTVEIIELEDNRCPKGATCVRAGEVHLRLKVSSKQVSEQLATCIGDDCGVLNEDFRNDENYTEIDTTAFTISGENYTLLFKEAVPVPEAEGDSQEVVRADAAVLEVIRQ